jgi:spore coat protein SA
MTLGQLPVPAIKGGAIETLVQILVEENEKKHKVEFIVISLYDKTAELLSRNYKYSRFYFIDTDNLKEKIYNVLVRLINIIPRRLFGGIEILRKNYYKKCLEIVRIEKPDFVVSEQCVVNVKFEYLLKFLKREQIFLHIHGHFLPSRKTARDFGGVIGVSKFVTKEYMALTSDDHIKPHTVYNCIDDDAFHEVLCHEEKLKLRKELGFFPTDFIVLFCGRIIKVKGVKELINAVIKIPNQAVKLMIIGSINFEGKENSSYLKEIGKLVHNWADRIIATGYVKNTCIYKYYQIADIMVVPSLWEEAFGLVVLEGMTCGLPLIVTNSGGMSELVGPQSAITVERDTNLVNNLSAKIEYLYHSEEQRILMARACKEEAKKFSRRKFYDDFVSVFK